MSDLSVKCIDINDKQYPCLHVAAGTDAKVVGLLDGMSAWSCTTIDGTVIAVKLTRFSDDDPPLTHALIALTELKGLLSLEIYECDVEPCDSRFANYLRPEELASISQINSLEELTLTLDFITSQEIHQHVRFDSLTHLKSLTVNGIAQVDYIASAITYASLLETLDLQRCTGVSDVGIQDISKCTSLVRLSLPSGTASTESISLLSNLEGLETLDASLIELGDEALLAITQMSKLKSLSIKGARLSDRSLSTICTISQLTQLSIKGAAVSPAALSAISRLGKLETLFLDSSGLDDEAIDIFITMPSVRLITAFGSRFTRRSLEKFKRMAPHCQLYI